MTEASESEFQTLLAAMLDGELSAEHEARLAEYLRTDARARQAYLDHCELHAFLQWEHGLLGGMEKLDVASSPEVAPRKPVFLPFARRWFTAAAAALLAFGVTLAISQFNKPTEEHPEVAGEKPVAAVLSDLKDAQWERGSWAAGQVLLDGQRLELKAGLVEVTFASGAKLVLEGPSALDVSSAWDASLRQGRVHAAIPAQARGFRLASAELEVDRGSEFSLLADEKGSSELFVHEGTVEGSYRGGNGTARTPWMLNAKEARRFSKLGATDIQDRERKWGKLQRLAQVVPQRKVSTITWSFDGEDRNLFAADGVSSAERSAAPGSGSSPSHFSSVDGRRNSALRIKSGGTLAVPLSELSVAKPRTLSIWIRVQPLSNNRSETLLAEWLVPAGSGGLKPLRVSLNDSLEHGSRGALRIDLGRFSMLSASPIDDGKWHHIAWVFAVGEGGPPLQYVNGRLESTTPRVAEAKPRKIARQNKADLLEGRLLLGGGAQLDIDDLQFTDGAMTPDEISELANPPK